MGTEDVTWWSGWADRLGIWAVAAGAIGGVLGVLAFLASQKAGSLKDDALTLFKTDSQRDISAANERASQADERAALANERAARLENETVDIRRKMAWREITPLVKEQFVGTNQHTEKFPVRLTYAAQNPEALSYAEQIAQMLREGGYTIAEMMSVMEPTPRVGVVMFVKTKAPEWRVMQLLGALKSVDLLDAVELGGKAWFEAEIMVGAKPNEG